MKKKPPRDLIGSSVKFQDAKTEKKTFPKWSISN